MYMREDKPLLPCRQADEALEKDENVGNSPISSVFILLNFMIAACYLFQPYVFKEVGIVIATCYFLLFAYATYEASLLLVKMGEICQLSDYLDSVSVKLVL